MLKLNLITQKELYAGVYLEEEVYMELGWELYRGLGWELYGELGAQIRANFSFSKISGYNRIC
jgi:hypothetical protein